MSVKLLAQLRQEKGKAVNKMRRAGLVPGVVYGHGIGNVNVAVLEKNLARVFRVVGENSLLELEIEGGKSHHVIIQEIQTDPVKDFMSHVDFLEVRLDQKIKAEVPIVFIGESAAVKELGGVLVKSIHNLEVEALPQDLPHNIEVDISFIKTFEDHIKISDIKVGTKAKVLAEADLTVASVVPPRSEAELESLKEEVVEDINAIEGVVKEEKTAEEAVKEEPKK